ncbi:MAG: hypothetical protein JRJ66_15260, partial [Deltaproteobacteria bacterium]|nr:hypothetical protein [Deltaproteobacteria bacterium]
MNHIVSSCCPPNTTDKVGGGLFVFEDEARSAMRGKYRSYDDARPARSDVRNDPYQVGLCPLQSIALWAIALQTLYTFQREA